MICIGLGSNLNDRKKYLRRAYDELCDPKKGHAPLLTKVRTSSIYESEALLPDGAPASWNQPFFNMVLTGETSYEPQELLARLKEIEKKIGRKVRERWAPREIDLDILAWDQRLVDLLHLKIPHAGFLERPFVLFPMLELEPNWLYPVQGPFCGQSLTALSKLWNDKLSGIKRLDDSVLSPDLVGIINVTPDSFSDGGNYLEAKKAEDRALELISQGARIIDIGAESTRPGAIDLKSNEEWARLGPVLDRLVPMTKKARVSLSIDTRHADTARKALKAGASWINDVTGFENAEMLEAVADSNCDLVFMHSLGVPPVREKILLANADPVDFLCQWAEKRMQAFESRGVDRERLIFDPGIGFGKSVEQNMAILRGAHRFLNLDVRVLIGHSRKSFLNQITQRPFSKRDIESLTLSLELARQKIHYVRVHQVEWHSRGFRALHFFGYPS